MNVKVFDFCGRIEFSRFLICGERDFGQRRPGKGIYTQRKLSKNIVLELITLFLN